MLTQVCNLSVGDDVATARHSGKLSNVTTSDDGTVCLMFEDGFQEWLESSNIAVKKDKYATFFVEGVHKIEDVV